MIYMRYLVFTAVISLLLQIVAGCATTAHFAGDRDHLNDAAFIVAYDTSSLAMAPFIVEELSKRGHSAYIDRPRQKKTREPVRADASSGTAFFISPTGIMLSNAHVVRNARSIDICTLEGSRFSARVMLSDHINDVAILEPTTPQAVKHWLSLAEFRQISVGDSIHIIGYPLTDLLGTQPRVTEGIVSASVGLLDDPTRFQVTAGIQPGNSGGPILDRQYRAVGIATERLSDMYALGKTGSLPQNVNFGVKMDYAAILFTQAIRDAIPTMNTDTRSLDSALKATVFVAVNSDNTPDNTPSAKLLSPTLQRLVRVEYNYLYSWDVFHYTLKTFSMVWTDEETGEVIATGNFSGSSFRSYKGIVRGVLREIYSKVAPRE